METPETGKGFWDSYDQKKQDLEAKISASDKMIAEDPSNAEAWCEKGTALVCFDRYEEALECLNKAIDLASTLWTFDRAFRSKISLLHDLGRHAEADVETMAEILGLIENNS